jgi:predicted phage gp36 major capsid-like protein
MDKRKAWRTQEQSLILRWNAAATRQQELQAQITRQSEAGGVPAAQLLLEAERSRSEMEAVRREVARMKVQFYTGNRY